MEQEELDLWNPTPEQIALENAKITLSKKRGRKYACLDMAFIIMTSRLKCEVSQSLLRKAE